jgi:hypothetical protein
MSANKNTSVCAVASPWLPVEVDAYRTGQEAAGPHPSGQNIIRPAAAAGPG